MADIAVISKMKSFSYLNMIKSKLRIGFFFALLYLPITSSGQLMQCGILSGVISDTRLEFPTGYSSVVVNYEFKSSKIALGAEPGVIKQNNSKWIGSIPLIVQYRFGNVWNVSPQLGLFYWTSKRGGVLSGVSIERSVGAKWIPFFNARFYSVLYRDLPSTQLQHITAFSIGIGLKFILNES